MFGLSSYSAAKQVGQGAPRVLWLSILPAGEQGALGFKGPACLDTLPPCPEVWAPFCTMQYNSQWLRDEAGTITHLSFSMMPVPQCLQTNLQISKEIKSKDIKMLHI